MKQMYELLTSKALPYFLAEEIGKKRIAEDFLKKQPIESEKFLELLNLELENLRQMEHIDQAYQAHCVPLLKKLQSGEMKKNWGKIFHVH